jgi:hypothetical protein
MRGAVLSAVATVPSTLDAPGGEWAAAMDAISVSSRPELEREVFKFWPSFFVEAAGDSGRHDRVPSRQPLAYQFRDRSPRISVVMSETMTPPGEADPQRIVSPTMYSPTDGKTGYWTNLNGAVCPDTRNDEIRDD